MTELRNRPISERLRAIEDLWTSIVADQHLLPDAPEVIAEVRARAARFRANPSSGVPWAEAKQRIRSQR